MNVIMAAVTAFAPTIIQLAKTDGGSNDFIEGLVRWGGGIGGGILALFLIFAIVKDGIAYAKGGGSVFPIIGKVLFLILCIGLIVIAINYGNIGNKAANLGNQAINVIENQANQAMSGGD